MLSFQYFSDLNFGFNCTKLIKFQFSEVVNRPVPSFHQHFQCVRVEIKKSEGERTAVNSLGMMSSFRSTLTSGLWKENEREVKTSLGIGRGAIRVKDFFRPENCLTRIYWSLLSEIMFAELKRWKYNKLKLRKSKLYNIFWLLREYLFP